ncbi:proton-coupled zinc antiporter SLC30A2-like [Scyliorhinus torazame]|uniref:proton-coupled zinc antiporter SLC30A2-like n=1 Tax=Scyliorhinus torazame TaxID=75743 RepID=UPI003B599DE2
MDEMSETASLLKTSLPRRSYPSAGTSMEHRETCETFVNELYASPTNVDPVLEQLESRHCHSSQSSGDHDKVDKENARRKLYLASAVCLVFIIGEVIGGYLAQSLAIMTDAAHLLTDFATMLVSLFSLWISSRPATKTMNFGWYRSEILGALISVLSIWVVTGVLVYLAVERLISGQYEIKGGVMLITSGCAVAVNIVMGSILHQSGHNHSHNSTGEVRSCDTESNTHGSQIKSGVNPNVRAAFIHVVGDLLQSFGVLIAAYIIYFKPEYKIVDPICTFLFSVLVLVTTLSILRDVLCILMEGTPKGMDFNQVKETLLLIDGVKAMHSLHMWALTINQPVLSVHIAINDDVNAQAILASANQRLQSQFDFHSITIQIENYSADMVNCRECQEPRD